MLPVDTARAGNPDPPDTVALSTWASSRAEAISGPEITLTPGSLDFGIVTAGQTSIRNVTARNVGTTTLTVTGIVISDPRFTSTATLPLQIPPSVAVSVPFIYAPTTPAQHAATFTFQSNSLSGPEAVTAVGQGTPTPTSILGDGNVLVAPTGEGEGDQFGTAVSSAGDMNGDGFDDFIVGAWTNNANGQDAGRAYVYFGGATPSSTPGLILTGAATNDNFGTSVASAGDLNGDGFDDVIVGAWANNAGGTDAGRAYVYFGGSTPNGVADLVFTGDVAQARLGVSVASAGDVNGDGFVDVIVGAFSNTPNGANTGRAFVYFGGPGADATADWTLSGEEMGDFFGWSVAKAGDANGDGYGDVLVGAPFNSTVAVDAGRGYLFFGGPGADAIPDRVYTGTTSDARHGVSVSSAGDVNGDGFSDIIVGAQGADSSTPHVGKAYVYFGGPGGDEVEDLTFVGDETQGAFGEKVASLDANGDGFSDLLVSAWLQTGRGSSSGRVYLFLGGATPDTDPDYTFTGEAGGDRLGVNVGAAGDVNGDGLQDFIMGAYFNDAGGGDAGRAYVTTLAPAPPAPVVVAPQSVNGATGQLITFTVTATPPGGSGDIASLTAASLPPGAAFQVAVGNTSGVFSWTPGPTQIGVFTVTFTAAAAHPGTASTSIVVNDSNRAPDLSPISDMTIAEGAEASQTLSANDPDGDPVSFFLGTGPHFAFVSTVGPGSGVLLVTPDFGDAGTYPATVEATDFLGASDDEGLTITVMPGNRVPTLTVPAGVFAAEGVAISFGVQASDPDGDLITLGATNRPVGSLFIDLGNSSGLFSWTPGFGQMGDYAVTFTARDARGADAAPRQVNIVVDDVNRGPVSDPGGPYSGVVNVPIAFDGTGSSDPDGQPLAFQWQFGDAATGVGATALHAYATGGIFVVTLVVNDGGLSASAATTATIQDVFPAAAFPEGGNKTIRLHSGKSTTFLQVEPVGQAYANTSVDVASIVMISPGTGSVDRIAVAGDKTTLGADKNHNGVDEITCAFAKSDVRALFDGLSGGRHTLAVTLEGTLTSGGRFRAVVELDVVASGNSLAATVTPNPLRSQGTITFVQARPGPVRVALYDLSGRRVRTLMDEANHPGGYHDVRIDGRRDDGSRLPSGVYFYRAETGEGTASGRFVVTK
jgi:hypothetical protein